MQEGERGPSIRSRLLRKKEENFQRTISQMTFGTTIKRETNLFGSAQKNLLRVLQFRGNDVVILPRIKVMQML